MANEHLALIYDGFFDGSTAVKVRAQTSNGTTILVYDEDSLVLLGTATISANRATVTVPALSTSQRIIAFVGAIGEKTYGGRTVLMSEVKTTGWRKPVSVLVGEDEVSVEDYEAENDVHVPAIYEPDLFNKIAEFPVDYLKDLAEEPITFVLRIERNSENTVVTIEDLQGVNAGYLIKFDNDVANTTLTKTYTSTGTFQVKVSDATNPLRFKTKTYSVTITAPPPPESEISNTSYTYEWAGALLGMTAFADSDVALEWKIDGVTVGVDGYIAMNFQGGRRWSNSYGTPGGPGNYTVRIRVIGDPADEVVFTATLA